MRNNKKLFSLITLMLFMVMVISGCSSKPAPAPTADAPKKIEIKYGSNEQNNMASGMASIWASKEIMAKSNGKINVSYHGQGTIGGDADLIQQVMAGNIQIGAFSIGAFSQYTPLLDPMQLHFLISHYEEEIAPLNSLECKDIVAKGAKKIVLTSSVAAIQHGNEGKVCGPEDWSVEEKCGAYQKSKVKAEKAAWKFWEENKGKFETLKDPYSG